ncbi:MAG: redoxin domain-containing protein [Armatimonadia bacterium]|nr:redoxin domain-containing protein [Armatimonadia bacterium]
MRNGTIWTMMALMVIAAGALVLTSCQEEAETDVATTGRPAASTPTAPGGEEPAGTAEEGEGEADGDETAESDTADLETAPEVGALAPEISVEGWINAEEPQTLEKLEGNVVLVEFWATWCPPCKVTIPHLNEIHAEYAPNGLKIVSLTDEPQDEVESFMEETPMDYPIGVGSMAGVDYEVSTIPHAFLVDENGVIVWAGNPVPGPGGQGDELEGKIAEMLG